LYFVFSFHQNEEKKRVSKIKVFTVISPTKMEVFYLVFDHSVAFKAGNFSLNFLGD
jgi:hypothetical protein